MRRLLKLVAGTTTDTELGVVCACRLDGVSGVRADVNASDEASEIAGEGDRRELRDFLAVPFVDVFVRVDVVPFTSLRLFPSGVEVTVWSLVDIRPLASNCWSSSSASSLEEDELKS